jgi:hypothetical protein
LPTCICPCIWPKHVGVYCSYIYIYLFIYIYIYIYINFNILATIFGLLLLYVTDVCAHYGYYKFHHRDHKSSLYVPIPSQINAAQLLLTYFLNMHLNITFASNFSSSKFSFLRANPPRLYAPLFSPYVLRATPILSSLII